MVNVNNMENQFVTYEVALKLREAGFDEECFGYFGVNTDLRFPTGTLKNSNHFSYTPVGQNPPCAAPLWQQVIDWLIETHHVWINQIYRPPANMYVATASSISGEEISYCVHASKYKNLEQSILITLLAIK